jgi:CheY-like chemotaxis protein
VITSSADIIPFSGRAPHTILVVEGEVLVRHVISEYLRECGYTVHEASGADEAIAILENPDVSIDVVFSEIEMAGSMDGFSLARWIRSNHPKVKVMLTSGVARSAQIAAELCEAGRLVRKPYEPQAVVDWIKQLLAKVDRTVP